MVGGAPPTRGVEGKKTRGQRGKDGVGIVPCMQYCTQHDQSLKKALVSVQGGDQVQCAWVEKVVYH